MSDESVTDDAHAEVLDLDAIRARYGDWTAENGRIALYSGGLTQEVAESAEDVPALVAEVERLTLQLQATQAAITKAKEIIARDVDALANLDPTELRVALSHADTSALAERDRLKALLPPVQRVTRAWTEVGISPGRDKAAQRELIKTWPVLARALENLVAAQAHLGRVD